MKGVVIDALCENGDCSQFVTRHKLTSRDDLKGKCLKQVQEIQPELYYSNGNRIVEHATITNISIVKRIAELVDRPNILTKNIYLGSLWDTCDGGWWNQFTIRVYETHVSQGHTIFHSTGQREYDSLIDEIIDLVNRNTESLKS